MGYLPRLRIEHKSSRHMGQIYVPFVNWILMLSTAGLVLGLGSSSKLAAAYGVAVTSTMLISSILFYVVARERWQWSLWAAALPTVLFLIIDTAFFSANVSKLLHGAWFPLVVGLIIFLLMLTWRRGRQELAAEYRARSVTWDGFQKTVDDPAISRINGFAVFLSGNPDVVPPALLHNLTHNRVLHSNVGILHVTNEAVPRVPNDRKVEVMKLGRGLHKIVAHYGYMEIPDIANILSLAREKGLEFEIQSTSFFLGREKLVSERGRGMTLFRKRLFAYMSRNALDVSTFFGIPVNRVMEVGVQLKL